MGLFHQARQDTFDEAITITTFLRGLLNHVMVADRVPKQQKLLAKFFKQRAGSAESSAGGSDGGGGG